MIHIRKVVIILCVTACVMAGCAFRDPHTIVSDYDKRGIRLIALAPVDNKTDDMEAARLLREKILEALYFKGYPRIPLSMIDEKLKAGGSDDRTGTMSPEAIGNLLGVDAVMYGTLTEWKTTFIGMYASTTVSVSLVLKDAQTGTTVWSAKHRIVERNYDLTRERLELKSYQAYEPAIREIIDKTLSSLPDGPDFVGSPPPEKKFWKFWQS